MKYKKGTFVVIPNKDKLRGKPSEMQSIYFWLCEHADDNGGCFPTKKTLMDEAGCSHNTLDKYLLQLQEEGFLKVKNRKIRGTKENTSNFYQILIVSDNPKMVEPPTKNGVTGHTKNGLETNPSINSNHLSVSAIAEDSNKPFKVKEIPLEFNFENELKKLSESYWKPDKIIALFWMRKKWKFENMKQFKTERSRQLKSAKALEGYNSEQLTKAFQYCEDNYSNFPWGLETCLKVIAKAINE